MVDKPLVTINILSYNRREELKNTLQKVFSQDYDNIQVIVVDNCSSDGTVEMVEKEFPEVELIQMNKNVGISGWNEGFKNAKSEYVLVLDDDSYPDAGTIEAGVIKMNESPNTGIVAFNIYNSRIKDYEKNIYVEKPNTFIGCGALIRKSALEITGYFCDLIFIYFNELELSARMYNNNYEIVVLEDKICIHNQTVLTRLAEENEDPFKSKFRFHHHLLSYSVFMILRINFIPGVFYLMKWFLNRILITIKMNYWRSLFKGIVQLIQLLPRIMKERKVLNSETQKFYRYGNEVLVDRVYFPDFKKPRIFK